MMFRLPHFIAMQLGILVLLATTLLGCSPPRSRPTVSPPASTATPKHAPMSTPDWLLINVPAGATQAEYGKEVYRLVCQDCHGDRGQGLTPEWRATWAPQDQNCWQSKCHAANHPPEGFILPIAPAIAGPAAMAPFATANDLYSFIQSNMPWYKPGSLVQKDAWAVTAYVLQLNQIDPGQSLDPRTAPGIKLR